MTDKQLFDFWVIIVGINNLLTRNEFLAFETREFLEIKSEFMSANGAVQLVSVEIGRDLLLDQCQPQFAGAFCPPVNLNIDRDMSTCPMSGDLFGPAFGSHLVGGCVGMVAKARLYLETFSNDGHEYLIIAMQDYSVFLCNSNIATLIAAKRKYRLMRNKYPELDLKWA